MIPVFVTQIKTHASSEDAFFNSLYTKEQKFVILIFFLAFSERLNYLYDSWHPQDAFVCVAWFIPLPGWLQYT